MKIAIVAPIAERVPPKKYGGTERVIYYQTEGLIRRGHKVTLFASGDSTTSAKLVSVIDKGLRESGQEDVYGRNIPALLNAGLAYSMQDQFDVIHDHNPQVSLPMANIANTPVVMTWHGPFDPELNKYFGLLRRPYVNSISYSQQRLAKNVNFIGNVYHGMDMEHYPFSDKPDNYLLFVGRLSMEKGPHYAIKAAKKLGIPLILGAKLEKNFKPDYDYFNRYVKPHLGGLIKWVGEVDEDQRNKLMSKALAFLHPVTWPEPFGLVLIESMACGLPVVAFKQGSIPELIKHGKTGYVAENFNQLLAGVKNIDKIDRAATRRYALENFTTDKMAQGYEGLYEKVLLLEELKRKKSVAINGSANKRQKFLLGFGSANN